MNTKERGMLSLLNEMRMRYGLVGVKAEFEAEGTRFEELLRLKDVVSRCGVEIALKIGGPEDVWGILQARRIGVSDIVAPMVESAYALDKFLSAIKKHVPEDEREEIIIAINIETAPAYSNLESLWEVGKLKGLQSVTVGRVDLAGSLGLSRAGIESSQVSQMVKHICRAAHENGFRSTVGGGIEKASLPLLKELVGGGLLDRFETRKIIFNSQTGLGSYYEAVRYAHRFELLWLENKREYNRSISEEDVARIVMLEQRIRA